MAGDVSDWLRSETTAHMRLLGQLREKLEVTLTDRDDQDADVNEAGTPSRDWCRAYARYQTGFIALLMDERERAKLSLLAKRSGQAIMSDEEYETELRDLGREALRELTTQELAAEFSRRGAAIPAGRMAGSAREEHEDS